MFKEPSKCLIVDGDDIEDNRFGKLCIQCNLEIDKSNAKQCYCCSNNVHTKCMVILNGFYYSGYKCGHYDFRS